MRSLLLACIAGALLAVGAGTAQAASSDSAVRSTGGDAGVLAGCNPDHARPEVDRSGHHIRGYGGFFGCTSYPYANMQLQRHRWYGWETLRSYSGTFVPGNYYWLFYDCRNTGTHTFRTFMSGYTLGGQYWSRQSRHFRTTC
jgi:hypothetical protein